MLVVKIAFLVTKNKTQSVSGTGLMLVVTNRTGNYDGSGNLTTNILNVATNPAAFYLLK